MPLFVAWSKDYFSSQKELIMRKKLFSSNLETNKLFERRPEEEESTELLLDDHKYRHKVQRPEGFETLCQRDPSCSEGCDVCCKLPYHNKSGEKKNKTSQPIICNGFQEYSMSIMVLQKIGHFGIPML